MTLQNGVWMYNNLDVNTSYSKYGTSDDIVDLTKVKLFILLATGMHYTLPSLTELRCNLKALNLWLYTSPILLHGTWFTVK